MGAIQQAFNQALAIGALATSPIARQKAEKRAEVKAIKKAETGADEALARMEEAFGEKTGTYSDQQLGDLVREAYEAQEASYLARPTLEKGALRAELHEHVQDWAAEEGASAVKRYREMNRDQRANMDAARRPRNDESGGAK